jgi:NAD(P)-dependent dehydrogenase (short-subunit alcohol dehydrogenase family)
MKDKLITITGCDSGIGRHLCGLLLDKGHKVAISFLEQNPFPDKKNLFAKKLDLRNENEITFPFPFQKY